MAFEYRSVTETDLREIRRLGINNRGLGRLPPEVRIVDQARDAFMLVYAGRGSLPAGGGEPPDFYTLVLRGQAINLEARHCLHDTPLGPHLSILLERLEIPAMLASEQSEILEMVREATHVLQAGHPRYKWHIYSSQIECDQKSIHILAQE